MADKKCEAVKVVVRCRPLNKKELADGRKMIVDVDTTANEVRLKNPEAPDDPVKSFPFDVVFEPGSAQSKVFQLCAKELVQAVIDGFNGTILAYGQTGLFSLPLLITLQSHFTHSLTLTFFSFFQKKELGKPSQWLAFQVIQTSKESSRDRSCKSLRSYHRPPMHNSL